MIQLQDLFTIGEFCCWRAGSNWPNVGSFLSLKMKIENIGLNACHCRCHEKNVCTWSLGLTNSPLVVWAVPGTGQMAVSLSIIGGLKGLLSAPLPAMCNIKCVAPPQYIERGLAGLMQWLRHAAERCWCSLNGIIMEHEATVGCMWGLVRAWASAGLCLPSWPTSR